MEFAIIIATLLVACIAWVVLGARADRRSVNGARTPMHAETAGTAAYGTTAFGGDAGGSGGDCG